MKVLIATPSYSGSVTAGYLIGMAETFRLSTEKNIQLNLHLWLNESLVQKARNNLFAIAYNQGYDELIFIDDDQPLSAEAFYNILSHDTDVVGYPVRMKTDEERYNIRPEDVSSHTFDTQLNLLEVQNIGTGFLRLNRKAIACLWDNSETYSDNSCEKRMICNLQIVNGGLISEDIQICEKLREHGFKIYADPQYTCSHVGAKEYKGSYMKHFILNSLDHKLAL